MLRSAMSRRSHTQQHHVGPTPLTLLSSAQGRGWWMWSRTGEVSLQGPCPVLIRCCIRNQLGAVISPRQDLPDTTIKGSHDTMTASEYQTCSFIVYLFILTCLFDILSRWAHQVAPGNHVISFSLISVSQCLREVMLFPSKCRRFWKITQKTQPLMSKTSLLITLNIEDSQIEKNRFMFFVLVHQVSLRLHLSEAGSLSLIRCHCCLESCGVSCLKPALWASPWLFY